MRPKDADGTDVDGVGFNGPLRHSISVDIGPSPREGERGEKG